MNGAANLFCFTILPDRPESWILPNQFRWTHSISKVLVWQDAGGRLCRIGQPLRFKHSNEMTSSA
jgi:hypothetical protein